jgi:hypothetical protein
MGCSSRSGATFVATSSTLATGSQHGGRADPDAPAFEHFSPTDLRRTFSHWMSDAGIPNELIAPLMGHKDTTMLDRVYNKKSPDELERAIRHAASLPDCRTGATADAAAEVPHQCRNTGADSGGHGGDPAPRKSKAPVVAGASSVPGDGIEPSTRGFSVPCSTN